MEYGYVHDFCLSFSSDNINAMIYWFKIDKRFWIKQTKKFWHNSSYLRIVRTKDNSEFFAIKKNFRNTPTRKFIPAESNADYSVMKPDESMFLSARLLYAFLTPVLAWWISTYFLFGIKTGIYLHFSSFLWRLVENRTNGFFCLWYKTWRMWFLRLVW